MVMVMVVNGLYNHFVKWLFFIWNGLNCAECDNNPFVFERVSAQARSYFQVDVLSEEWEKIGCKIVKVYSAQFSFSEISEKVNSSSICCERKSARLFAVDGLPASSFYCCSTAAKCRNDKNICNSKSSSSSTINTQKSAHISTTPGTHTKLRPNKTVNKMKIPWKSWEFNAIIYVRAHTHKCWCSNNVRATATAT